ncbi:hypothetical protein [Streptomyces sp. NPDC101206]|uniref:hypothetical protein n=1 Tax=Streptomyces sp. NPDC101206 TaxID=3366128 RepID=UPI0037F8DB37
MSEPSFTPSERAAIATGIQELAITALGGLAVELEEVIRDEGAPTRPRRSAIRRIYDRAAAFAGPLMVFMICGSIGLFVGAALVVKR